jgi:SAM-dependent methyltransferase
MSYQDFGDGKHDSKSTEKLKAIHLPNDLTGKRVLDVGCNEGFFCQEALRRGASYVLGIDANNDIIQKARVRVPGAKFQTSSWWNIADEQFDLIIFLSAIHYEKDQKALLNFLKTRLKPDGVLILECGVVRNDWDEKWHAVERHDGFISFPSWSLLVNQLLENFAVRDIGRSVAQPGDPVPRYVFHCRHLQPTVIFLGGDSQSGKTVLSREFRKKGVRVINLDFEYGKIIHDNNTFRRHAGLNYMISAFNPNSVDLFLKKIVEDKMEDHINNIISNLIRPDASITILEGYHFYIPSLRESLEKILTKSGYNVVEVNL